MIYDKRGSGESTGDWKTSMFDDLANDAAAAIALLRARADIDSREIGIAGPQPRRNAAPLIATKSPVATFTCTTHMSPKGVTRLMTVRVEDVEGRVRFTVARKR